MGFDSLGLSDELLKAVGEMGYENPTPIQEKAIPAVFMARDILGCAQTGTGKTASFTLPMIDILAQGRSRARMPRSLIISPTRELAQQIAENFAMYGKYTSLEMALLIGGTSMKEQEQAVDKGVDVLICTPGRLLDLYQRGRVMLNDVKILVIDEADRMMDMGFIPDVETIVGALSPTRQTLFFSATMAPEIRKVADQFLQNPKEITVTSPQSTATTVKHFLSVVGPRDKRKALRQLMKSEDVKNAFVFCNRKKDISILVDSLQRHGYDSVALHGDLSQSQRTQSLDYFRDGHVKLLICSDVAARGIDISNLSHVFNFDVPHHAEDYVHRIGRTGRAGKEGRAFTIATPDDEKMVDAIEKLTGASIDKIEIEALAPRESSENEAPARGGRGRRGSKPAQDKAAEERTSAAASYNKDKKPAGRLSREERRRAHSNHPADKEVGEMPTNPSDFYKSNDTDSVREARSAFEAHVPAFFVGGAAWYEGLTAPSSPTPQAEKEERSTRTKRVSSRGRGGRKRSPGPKLETQAQTQAQTPTGTSNVGSLNLQQRVWRVTRYVRRLARLKQAAKAPS